MSLGSSTSRPRTASAAFVALFQPETGVTMTVSVAAFAATGPVISASNRAK